jgi:hypothetical protein
MKGFLRNYIPLIVAASFGACARVLALTPTGARVRQVSADEAKACKFVQTLQYTDTVHGTGKTPGLVHQTVDIGLRNEVVSANAFIGVHADADWFSGHVSHSGEAYPCPE